jgi:hypothetical protein
MSTLATTIGRGVTGSRPSASEAGRLYYDTTASIFYRDNGSSWDSVSAAALTNPMDGAGQIIYGGVAGAPTKLAAGTVSQALIGGSTPSWSSAVGLLQSSRITLTTGNLTTGSGTFGDATGLTTTITTGARRCIIEFTCSVSAASSSIGCVDIAIDGTRVGGTDGLAYGQFANGGIHLFYLSDVLTAASHTFKIQFKDLSGAATLTLYASTSMPAILTVLETGLTT